MLIKERFTQRLGCDKDDIEVLRTGGGLQSRQNDLNPGLLFSVQEQFTGSPGRAILVP